MENLGKKDFRNKIIRRAVSVVLTLVLLLGDSGAVFSYAAETTGADTKPALVSSVNGTWLVSGDDFFNLRKASKNKSDNFGVLQGGCTDGGSYAYFAFMRKSDDTVRIVKMRIVPGKAKGSTYYKYVSSTPALKGSTHGNDLAYVKNAGGSGKDKIFVTTAADDTRVPTYITTIDVATMKEQGGKAYNYWKDLSECSDVAYPPDSNVKKSKRRTLKSLVSDHHGFSNLSYCPEKNLFVALVKTDRDIIILRPVWSSNGTLLDLKLQRYIRQNKKNATSQGIDCDSNYIYTSWSAKSGVLSNNILQIYDWEGNHVGNRALSNYYELENVFHTGKGSKARFYANYYHSYYETYEAKEKYKVRWKKVTKRVKVKTKKTKKKKVHGKIKKVPVYKWKKKKVWKYKTKWRKVTKDRIVRNAYCMYLGNLTH